MHSADSLIKGKAADLASHRTTQAKKHFIGSINFQEGLDMVNLIKIFHSSIMKLKLDE